MNKTIAIVLILAVFAGIALGVEPDIWTQIEWNYQARRAYTNLNDGNMAGLQDSSILYIIPPDAGELQFLMYADSGSTVANVGDADSVLVWANLIPWGGTYANGVLYDGVTDSLIAAENADSFYSWGLKHKIVTINDTFNYTMVFPPSDSASAFRAIGNRDLMDYSYIGFRVRVTDSTGLGGNTRCYFRFLSRANSWVISGDKSGH